MASQDVLTTALQELMPGYKTTWDDFNPLIERVVKGLRKQPHNHPYKEFGLVPEGPGQFKQILTGWEVLPGGRNQSGVKGNAYAAMHNYRFEVPFKDLREANGKADVIGLIKKYPERALLDMQQKVGRQLATGDVSQVNVPTLNGDTTYNPDGTARQGIFEFAAAAAQTTTVFGVQKNSIVGWHNQFGEITSFPTDGLYTMFEVYSKANVQGQASAKGVDLITADSISFNNYRDNLDNRHVIMNKDLSGGAPKIKGPRMALPFEGADLMQDPQIITSSFTTPAATEGVMYFLCTDDWYCFFSGAGAGEDVTDGNFAARKPYRVPGQELRAYEFVLSMGLYTDNLRSQGAVVGGNRR
jgi:hypothetical protein